MVRVFLPSGLRRLTSEIGKLAACGETVCEIIDDLERQYPSIRDRLCDGDRLWCVMTFERSEPAKRRRPEPLLESGSLIPKAFLKKPRKRRGADGA